MSEGHTQIPETSGELQTYWSPTNVLNIWASVDIGAEYTSIHSRSTRDNGPPCVDIGTCHMKAKGLLVLGTRSYPIPVQCTFSTTREHSGGRYNVGSHPVYNCWRVLPRDTDVEASCAWLGKMGTCKIA